MNCIDAIPRKLRIHRFIRSARQALAVVLVLSASGTAALAQTWTAVNVILPGPAPSDPGSAPAGFGSSVLIDPFNSGPAPGLIMGIQTYTAGAPTIFRLTPTDAASSSYMMEELDSALSSTRGLAHVPGQGIFAVGEGSGWKVRKSSSGNRGTWTDDDTFTLAKNAFSTALGIAHDTHGNLFVAGVARESRSGAPHWIVRRKVTGAKSWATVFDAKGNNVNMVPAVCYFPGNLKNPTPAIFTSSDLNSRWSVRRSQLQGATGTWVEVDTWREGPSESAAYGMAYDSVHGVLYAIGCRGLNGRNPSAWVIRSSDDGGNTWRTLLDRGGAGSWAASIAIESNGSATVAGVINPTSGTSTSTPLWKIIRCTNPQDPGSWAESFADPGTVPFGSTASKGREAVVGVFGDVFAIGEVSDWVDASTSPSTVYSGSRVGLLRLVP
jgi:hypothetical protein